MGIFDLFRKKEIPIDFSDQNVSELTKKSDFLGNILIENGFGFYVDHLSRIRLSADNKNEKEFRKLVVSPELFGGSGGLCDINIENATKNRQFNRQFSEYIDILTRMGINNKRMFYIQKNMSNLK